MHKTKFGALKFLQHYLLHFFSTKKNKKVAKDEKILQPMCFRSAANNFSTIKNFKKLLSVSQVFIALSEHTQKYMYSTMSHCVDAHCPCPPLPLAVTANSDWVSHSELSRFIFLVSWPWSLWTDVLRVYYQLSRPHCAVSPSTWALKGFEYTRTQNCVVSSLHWLMPLSTMIEIDCRFQVYRFGNAQLDIKAYTITFYSEILTQITCLDAATKQCANVRTCICHGISGLFCQ